MSYKPLPDNLTIKESPIDGLGVFATQDINIETILSCYSHMYIEEPNISGELQRLNFGGFVNHNKEPNCTLELVKSHVNNRRTRSYYKLKTLNNITAEEEITLDYTRELCGLTGYTKEEWLNK